MKQCSKCKQEKQVAEFNKDKARKDGLQNMCRQCKNAYGKQYRQDNPELNQYGKQHYHNNIESYKQYYTNKKLSYNIVYLLPDYNYVGVTDNPTFRMYRHQSKHNRNTSNWVELKRFDTREEALAYESQLHSQGYAGGK